MLQALDREWLLMQNEMGMRYFARLARGLWGSGRARSMPSSFISRMPPERSPTPLQALQEGSWRSVVARRCALRRF
jgi:hypothetical protein